MTDRSELRNPIERKKERERERRFNNAVRESFRNRRANEKERTEGYTKAR